MKKHLPILLIILIAWFWFLRISNQFLIFYEPAQQAKGTATSSEVIVTVKIPKRYVPPPPLPPSPPGGGGGGGGGAIIIPAPLPTKIIFKGFSSPNAFVYVYKNGALAATLTAAKEGTFYGEITGLYGKIYAFTFAAEDKEKRPTMTVSVAVSIIEGAITTIENIFLPPTIQVEPGAVKRGESVSLFGATYPQSNITAFVTPRDIVATTTANRYGYWTLPLDTKPIPEGNYFVTAAAQKPDGLQSPQAQILQFSVVSAIRECRGSDINLDGKVDIYDFSILMFWWNATKIIHPCGDINKDKKVNLIDFSIMMYNWNKKF